jgi:DNA modification methylase
LRGDKGAVRIEGEGYTLGEQIQYTDIWANDEYLQFMYDRLMLLRELLADGGSMFLHCDHARGHQLRCLMDEVFGPNAFVNEIIWSYRRWPSETSSFQNMHDNILFYAKEVGKKRTFHKFYEGASESYLKRFGGKTQVLDPETKTRKITSEEETKGMPLRDVWDISVVAGSKAERTSYPTQKPEALIARIIESSTNPGDLVLDCFVGSGTTSAVAQQLGRRWIGADINRGAIQTTSKRIQDILSEDLSNRAQGSLTDDEISAAQLAFTTWRVNDYDLQIQHNEAVELASQHLGVQRSRTDAFFDGTLGKNLTKIVPFTHPLSPVDLESIKNELGARPDEDRSVTVVCLGAELAAKKWIDDWNRLRRGRNAINRIEYIELRSDAKHGGWIKHEPASAKVDIKREDGRVVVDIRDFVSPAIVERLRRQTGVTKPKIDNWRAMVDSVMIDTDYDGKVFDVVLSDVPERKQDFVAGRYEMPASDEATLAVRITDMLGEEVLVTSEG